MRRYRKLLEVRRSWSKEKKFCSSRSDKDKGTPIPCGTLLGKLFDSQTQSLSPQSFLWCGVVVETPVKALINPLETKEKSSALAIARELTYKLGYERLQTLLWGEFGIKLPWILATSRSFVLISQDLIT